ncbi:hypothetical protein D3C87_1672520 [compost metagenome]
MAQAVHLLTFARVERHLVVVAALGARQGGHELAAHLLVDAAQDELAAAVHAHFDHRGVVLVVRLVHLNGHHLVHEGLERHLVGRDRGVDRLADVRAVADFDGLGGADVLGFGVDSAAACCHVDFSLKEPAPARGQGGRMRQACAT